MELRLGGARRGPAAQPGELLGEQVGALGGGHVGLTDAFGAGQRVGGVGAVVDLDVARYLRAVASRVNAGHDLPDVFAHGIQEPAVVGDGQEGAGRTWPGEARVQVGGQPGHALDVEVVGGLVQAHDVGVGGKHPGQGDAPALASRQGCDQGGGVDVGEQPGVDVAHCRVRCPLVFFHAGVDRLHNGVIGSQGVGLRQERDPHPVAPRHHSRVGFLGSGDDAQERGLARPVGAEDADARAVIQANGHAVEEPARPGEGCDALCSQQVCH